MSEGNQKDKHLGLRIDPETHYKLFYIAKYEGRSGSREILTLIRKCISEFEEKHGSIHMDESAE